MFNPPIQHLSPEALLEFLIFGAKIIFLPDEYRNVPKCTLTFLFFSPNDKEEGQKKRYDDTHFHLYSF
jgi:hypothetical protein